MAVSSSSQRRYEIEKTLREIHHIETSANRLTEEDDDDDDDDFPIGLYFGKLELIIQLQAHVDAVVNELCPALSDLPVPPTCLDDEAPLWDKITTKTKFLRSKSALCFEMQELIGETETEMG